MAITAAITAVVGTVVGVSQTNKAAKASKAAGAATQRAAETQVQIQREQATRQRRSSIRQVLSQRSQLAARAQALNVAGSSGAAGGQSAISSQLGANLGFGNMMSGLGQQYTSLTAQAANFGGQAQLAQSYAGLGFQTASAAGGLGAIQTGFNNLNFGGTTINPTASYSTGGSGK